MTGTARLSDDGVYRYELSRSWGDGPHALWVMLNPSVADATRDDQTVRQCCTFTQQWGLDGIIVGNLFALRSTDPKVLLRHPDPIGPDNDATLSGLAARPQVQRIVCAWGAHGWIRNRGLIVARDLARAALARGVGLVCLGVTKTGQPLHPARLGHDLPLQEYRP